jgi:asparagine synthase (glutamine-hydrolysing)
MCGIAGFVGFNGLASGQAGAVAIQMAQKIAHRGPDDAGVWVDDSLEVALGHRRLSIIDLSPAGHQPMVSASGRYVMVFNGEIYNHQALRRELSSGIAQSVKWRGHSDTETLLGCFDAWGVEKTLRATIGMFAIALVDREKREMCLARDRMGEKPLYYGWQKGVFLFGSELKALKAHPGFVGEIERNAIALQLRHNYIPAPYSIYRDIQKLPPGTFLRVCVGTSHSAGPSPNGRREVPQPYWSLSDVLADGHRAPFSGNDAEAVDALDLLLRDSVRQQMAADVPLGAFLSGGIDSSTIVALMQAQSSRAVRTFTIGFREEGYNEAEHAKAVARHLGTEHTELYVSPTGALDVIPRLPALYDEPFSDSSQVPTFLISQLTRQHVTVSLSGDAGDELFGGYPRYFRTARIWRMLNRLPGPARKGIGRAIHSVSESGWNRLAGPFIPLLPPTMGNFGHKARKLGETLGEDAPEAIYRGQVSHWEHPSRLVIGSAEPQTVLTDRARWRELADVENRMMYLDAMSYLPDDILCKVDRAAMGVSLETRIPMLDHRVVEFAWRLPMNMKIRNGQGKWILRQVLHKYVPRQLTERPKMGFGVPIDGWLRGPLREWAESLLDGSRLRQEGFLDPGPIRQKWAEHLSRRYNWQHHLWDVLMFQAWLEQERMS